MEYQIDEYDSLDQRSHVYEKPGMYVGSDEHNKRRALTYDIDKKTFAEVSTTLPTAVERFFIEILQNATDNCARSRDKGVSFDPIDVQVDGAVVSVCNTGIPILIEKTLYKEKGIEMWIPEMLFGEFRTGQNYGKDQNQKSTTSGTNGLGANAVNVFSKIFEVTTASSEKKKKYYQQWSDNMLTKTAPEITKYSDKESFTEVLYELDFDRFQLEGYTQKDLARFAGIAAVASASAKVPILFNDVLIDLTNFETFVKKLFPEPNVKKFYHTQGETYDLCYVDWIPSKVRSYGFTNGIENIEGGTHVNAAYDALKPILLKDLNAKSNAKPLKLSNLKSRISVVVCYRGKDPGFSGQEKHKLTSKCPKVSLDKTKAEKLKSWKACKKLEDDLAEQDADKIRAEGDAEMMGKLNTNKYIPAEWSKNKSKKNKECLLLIAEGDSAGQYVKKIREKNGNSNRIGILIGRGKWINPQTKPEVKVYQNRLIRLLRHALGIKGNKVPKLEDLRYGRVGSISDADVDGEHISGLLYNVVNEVAPCLTNANQFYIYRTPLVKTWKKGKRDSTVQFFYSEELYEDWLQENPHAKKWQKKYYKGLGTSKGEDVTENEKNPLLVKVLSDKRAQESLKYSFGSGSEVRQRKREWILGFRPREELYNEENLKFSHFVDHQLVKYAIGSNTRSLPNFMDGMKPSQRKILCAAFLRWGRNIDLDLEIKVAQFSPYVSTNVVYNHGEKSLEKAIGSLADIYVGSSNMNMLYPSGQFGTRSNGANDMAAARYIYVRPEPWINKVFRAEDDLILTYVKEDPEDTKSDKKKCEPETYYPVVPYALGAGVRGIATGWSSDIPPCNMLDVAEAVLDHLEGNEIKEIIPWFRGFTGTVKYYPKGLTKKVKKLTQNQKKQDQMVKDAIANEEEKEEEDEDDKEEEEEEEEEDKNLPSCLTEGVFDILPDGRVKITELPATVKIDKYKVWLARQVENGVFKNVADNCGTDYIEFIISGAENPSIKSLNLSARIKTTNMVFLKDNLPTKYERIDEYIRDWTDSRLEIYSIRKEKTLLKMRKDIEELELRLRFIRLVIDGEINISSLKNDQVLAQLKEHDIPADLYRKTYLSSITKDKVGKLERKIEEAEKEYSLFEKMAPRQIFINEVEEFIEYWEELMNSPQEEKIWKERINDPHPEQKTLIVYSK